MQKKYNKYGIHINTNPMFFRKEAKCILDKRILAIRAFTSSNIFLNFLFNTQGFKLQKSDNIKLKMTYKGESIKFEKFSDYLKIYPGEEATVRELLNVKKRIKTCHDKSVQFVSFGNFVVTGYVDDGDGRIIHTWIETDKDVIDYSSNLVIDKDIFYKLLNVDVLSVIKKDDVFEDFNNNSKFLTSFMSYKFYCLFRNELYDQGLMQFDSNMLIKK